MKRFLLTNYSQKHIDFWYRAREAVLAGDTKKLKFLIEEHPEVFNEEFNLINAIDKVEDTTLGHEAAHHSTLGIIDILGSNGADFNIEVIYKGNPITAVGLAKIFDDDSVIGKFEYYAAKYNHAPYYHELDHKYKKTWVDGPPPAETKMEEGTLGNSDECQKALVSQVMHHQEFCYNEAALYSLDGLYKAMSELITKRYPKEPLLVNLSTHGQTIVKGIKVIKKDPSDCKDIYYSDKDVIINMETCPARNGFSIKMIDKGKEVDARKYGFRCKGFVYLDYEDNMSASDVSRLLNFVDNRIKQALTPKLGG